MTISEDVRRLLPALEEAARANQHTVERFVPPRTGIVEQVSARRHQFVLGRRGVGKTTLLRVVEQAATQGGSAVAFVDLETLRGIPYPDVLINLLIRVLGALRKPIRNLGRDQSLKRHVGFFRVNRSIRRLERELHRLLGEPQTVRRTVTRLKRSETSASGRLNLAVAIPHVPVIGSGQAKATRDRSDIDEIQAEFDQTKMEGLFAAATAIRRVLEQADRILGDPGCTIILDDFYHVARTDQPHVLAYLHQVTKNIGIFMKIGAVQHRLVSFLEGDPPTGLQVGHDAGELSLDVTLESFDTAQSFLERVLGGVVESVGSTVDELLTPGGRTRLVLASVGVARDYLNLTSQALRIANERQDRPARPHNRITAEDVNEVSRHLAEQKEQDLVSDAGENADALRSRLSNLVTFCLDRNRTNVFLVESSKLRETDWGRDIEALAELRFIHRISSVSVQTSNYRGRQFTAFTLDLSSYTGTRSERIRQIEFWTTDGHQDLRRVGLIFIPGQESGTRSDEGELEAAVDWTQDPLPGIAE
jgi:hypothetical protein